MSGIVEYLAFFIIAIILVGIIFYLIMYNATLNLEKRIKKYSIDSIKETNISSATLSRVSKCVKYGEGYKKIISKENKNGIE